MKYAAGYCVALLMIAGTWIRLSVLQEGSGVNAPHMEAGIGSVAWTEGGTGGAGLADSGTGDGGAGLAGGTVETISRTATEEMALVGEVWGLARAGTGWQKREASVGMEKEAGQGYRQLYPDMYVDPKSKEVNAGVAEEETRKVYLTFDDGPSEVTKDVLAALDQANAKAAFFLIGSEITEEREELVRQMAADGHIIGVHTYSHESKDLYSSVESFLEDFHKTYERIYEVTGQRPYYYRFPWGSVNCYNKNIREDLIAEMERRGFQFFDWNVSAEDSIGKPTEYSILHNVVDSFPKYRQAVVLMHDSINNKLSAKMLPRILAAVQEAGYEFRTIDQMEKPYQWVKR